MASQICPNCGADNFYWTIEDEPYTVTDWFCNICQYQATEDERLERICKICGNKSESLLADNNGKYWWCFECLHKTEAFSIEENGSDVDPQ